MEPINEANTETDTDTDTSHSMGVNNSLGESQYPTQADGIDLEVDTVFVVSNVLPVHIWKDEEGDEGERGRTTMATTTTTTMMMMMIHANPRPDSGNDEGYNGSRKKPFKGQVTCHKDGHGLDGQLTDHGKVSSVWCTSGCFSVYADEDRSAVRQPLATVDQLPVSGEGASI